MRASNKDHDLKMSYNQVITVSDQPTTEILVLGDAVESVAISGIKAYNSVCFSKQTQVARFY